MNNDIFWLGLILLQTALMFVPYALNLFYKQGLIGALRYYEPNKPELSDWAMKAKAAHSNSVENLVVLAPAALAHMHLQTSSIALYLQVYFWARIAHYVVYAMKLNYVRTVFFFVGWGATVMIILDLIRG